MTQSSYKSKVIHQDALHFCLSVVDFFEALPAEKEFFKQAALDALTFCEDLQQAGLYLSSLKELTINHSQLDRKKVLIAAQNVGEASDQLGSFLQTLKALAELKNFSQWDEFLTTAMAVSQKNVGISDFLTTVRHIAELSPFNSWQDFFVLAKRCIESKDQAGHEIVRVFEAVRHSLQYFKKSEAFKGIFRALAEAPQYSEAFAHGQLDSKKWLVEEAQKVWGRDWGVVFILAGWIGSLPRMMWDADIQTLKIRSFDIDESANKAAEFLNQNEVQKDWLFKSSTLDVAQMKYPAVYSVQRKDGTLCELEDMPDVVINTSCEHIQDIQSWWQLIPMGTKVILQTNDGFHIPEHVACFNSLQEFAAAMNLSQVDYQGQKALPEFNRFMLIGKK